MMVQDVQNFRKMKQNTLITSWPQEKANLSQNKKHQLDTNKTIFHRE